MSSASLPTCPFCQRGIGVTKAGEFKVHGPRADRCEGSGTTPVEGAPQPVIDHQYLGTMGEVLARAPQHTGNGRTRNAAPVMPPDMTVTAIKERAVKAFTALTSAPPDPVAMPYDYAIHEDGHIEPLSDRAKGLNHPAVDNSGQLGVELPVTPVTIPDKSVGSDVSADIEAVQPEPQPMTVRAGPDGTMILVDSTGVEWVGPDTGSVAQVIGGPVTTEDGLTHPETCARLENIHYACDCGAETASDRDARITEDMAVIPRSWVEVAIEDPRRPILAPPTPDITAERLHETEQRAQATAAAIARRRAPVTPAWTGTQRLDSLGADVVMGRKEVAKALIELFRAGRSRLSCDIESEGKTGIAARSLKAVIFSPWPEGDVAVILDPRDEVQAKLVTWAFDNATELIFHNSPFDVPNLAMNGLFRPEHAAKVSDTLIWARGAEPDNSVSKALGDCGKRYLGLSTDKGIQTAMKAAGMKSTEQYYREMDLDRPFYARGAATDAIVTARLRDKARNAYLERLTVGHPFAEWGVEGEEAQRLVDREQRLNRMSLRRTCYAYEVDMGYLDEFNERQAQKIEMVEGKLREFKIRPTNAQDLLKVLDAQDLVPPEYPRTETGLMSGSKDHLPMLGSPLAKLFLWHKEQVHILKDYLLKVRDLAIERDGKMLIFPTINYFGATTGRMSMGNPPLQQFPEAARGMLLGDWSSIDWSQIEPVTIANVAGQEDVLHGYEHEGKKFYTVVEQLTGIPYKQAKTQLLGTLYGQGLDLTAAKLGVSPDEARRIKDAIFAPMPRVFQLTKTLRQLAKDYRLVPTVSGRILPIPMGKYKGEWSVATHKGVNYFTQGSAYDVLAECALTVEDAGYGDHLHLLMHDELVVSTEVAPEIRKLMEVPPARLIERSGRTPILHTDMTDLGDRWNVA